MGITLSRQVARSLANFGLGALNIDADFCRDGSAWLVAFGGFIIDEHNLQNFIQAVSMVFIIVSFSRKIDFISNARERCDVLKWHEVNGDPRIYVVELDAFEAHDLHLACFFYLLPQGNRCNC